MLDVHLMKFRRDTSGGGAAARLIQHRPAGVDSDGASARPNQASQRQHVVTGAAAKITDRVPQIQVKKPVAALLYLLKEVAGPRRVQVAHEISRVVCLVY